MNTVMIKCLQTGRWVSTGIDITPKGDGLIWIKRKHYFESDLNPFFFQRYLDRRK
jgi:hypothetical protein